MVSSQVESLAAPLPSRLLARGCSLVSWFGLLLLFAYRLLTKGRFTFALLVSAVAFGVGFQIPNAANLAGYSQELLTQGMKRATGHVTVTGARDEITNAHKVLARLEAIPCVRRTATRLAQAALLVGKTSTMAIRLVAIDLDREQAATGICRRVANGSCVADRKTDVLVGATAAEDLAIVPGQTIVVAIPTPDGGAITKHRYRVAGILRGGGAFQEDKDVILSDAALGGQSRPGDAVTSILVFGADARRADSYRDAIRRALPEYRVESWRDAAGFVAQAIDGVARLTWVSLIMVMCAVLVPVLALSYIHVTAERRQIGALRAVGMTRVDVLLIYLFKSVLVAAVGCGIGVLLGIGLCAYFHDHPLFASDGFVVRPHLTWEVFVSSLASVGLTTIVSGVWPAMRAALTSPIEELSGT